MARVTVEDCMEIVPNRFDLVVLATRRSREIAAGSTLTVERNKDKNPVVALREIAEKSVSISNLQENIIRSMQRNPFRHEPEEVLDTGFEEALHAERVSLLNSPLRSFMDADSDEDREGEDKEEDILTSQIEEAEAVNHLNLQEET